MLLFFNVTSANNHPVILTLMQYNAYTLQRLRVQSVLDLLSTLSSSPGGETGFDRLVAGLRSVLPALTQALTDELNVLVRVTEAHAVLSFLNAAYLGTIAQELTSLMERECEAALRDNTTLGSKIRKNSAKSNSTAGKSSLVSKTNRPPPQKITQPCSFQNLYSVFVPPSVVKTR